MKRFIVLYSILYSQIILSGGTPGAFWNSLKSIPVFHKKFWNTIGTSVEGMFGKSPIGYSYSCVIHNDTNQTMYIATQDLICVLGGTFPQARSFTVTAIQPYSEYTMTNKGFYFYFLIKTTDKVYVDRLPYLDHDDVIYQKVFTSIDPTYLNNQYVDHYRIYIGQSLRNGMYHYGPAVELVGSQDSSAKGAQKGLSLTTKLSEIVIKNQTDQSYKIGFFANTTASTTDFVLKNASAKSYLKAGVCARWAAPQSVSSFCGGTIVLFDSSGTNVVTTLQIPLQVFNDFGYSAIVYEQSKNVVAAGLQGLTIGAYEPMMADGVDITPVPVTIWHQSLAQMSTSNKGLQDLAGTVWTIVMTDSAGFILGGVKAGQAITTELQRVAQGQTWLFWIYVNEADAKKEQAFLNNIMVGLWSNSMVNQYMHNSVKFLDQAESTVNFQTPVSKNNSVVVELTHALLQSSLQLNKGKMVDEKTGVTGYLLGLEAFASTGLGGYPMTYIVKPSYANAKNLPTSSVDSVYMEEVLQGSTIKNSLLKNMPKATVVSYPSM